MKRLVLPLILFAMLVAALPAQAGEAWCMSDPIVRLNGTRVQILVAIPETYQPLVNGPIEIQVKTPRSTTRELLYTDAGFNGHGERVTFSNLPMNPSAAAPVLVTVAVRVPLDRSRLPGGIEVPARVTVLPDNAGPTVGIGTHQSTVVSTMVRGTR